MSSRFIKGRPSQIFISKESEVLHFDLSEGSLVCLYDKETQITGSVLVRASSEKAPQILSNLVKSFSGVTGREPSEVFAKILGRAKEVAAVKKSLFDLNLKIEKELCEDQKALEAYVYSNTGRVRVGEVERGKEVIHAPAPSTKKKVLIVDDSKTIRSLLTKIFSSDSRFEVVAAAEKPSQVVDLILQHKPDVITLDIHMPEKDGVTLLGEYLPRFRIPTVMITSIRMEEGDSVLRALEIGAVDYIQKPSLEELQVLAPMICDKVFEASKSSVRVRSVSSVASVTLEDLPASSRLPVICIGSSTGGTEALRQMFTHLPELIPPILIVQHIPAVFSKAFADRLNIQCRFEVREAQDGDEVLHGLCLIAPGEKQMKLKQRDGRLFVQITDDPPVNRFKPSVDYLFNSAAEVLGRRAYGVILTGMGSDGAKGLLKMKEAGARTIAQDEATSVVYGMPRVAFEMGAAEATAALDRIPYILWKWIQEKK